MCLETTYGTCVTEKLTATRKAVKRTRKTSVLLFGSGLFEVSRDLSIKGDRSVASVAIVSSIRSITSYYVEMANTRNAGLKLQVAYVQFSPCQSTQCISSARVRICQKL